MNDEQRPTPGPTTEAMRLRPATRPGADPATARARQAGAIDSLEAALAERGERIERLGEQLDYATDRLAEALDRLDAVLELHRVGQLVPLCVECLMPHPCPTYRAAAGDPVNTDTPEDESQ